MKTYIIIAVIGFGWVTFINTLDEKRTEAYQYCKKVETIDGDYQRVCE